MCDLEGHGIVVSVEVSLEENNDLGEQRIKQRLQDDIPPLYDTSNSSILPSVTPLQSVEVSRLAQQWGDSTACFPLVSVTNIPLTLLRLVCTRASASLSLKHIVASFSLL
jgi:hypothetical protein